MRYVIESSSWPRYEVKERYPCLEKYGIQEEARVVLRRQFIWDENGKRLETDPIKEIKKYYTIEIFAMEELSHLIKDVENPVIVDNRTWFCEDWTDLPCIEIYDSYRE